MKVLEIKKEEITYIYETVDGRKFTNKKDAVKYEDYLEAKEKIRSIRKLERIIFDSSPYTLDLYYPENEEQLKTIINCFANEYFKIVGTLSVGDRIAVGMNDWGDYNTVYLYSLNYIEQELKDDLSIIQEIKSFDVLTKTNLTTSGNADIYLN